MNGNIEIKVSGLGDCAGQGGEVTAEIAITHGFARLEDDSISVNTLIGGMFKGKKDLVKAYGEATAQAIHSLAEDNPRIIEVFEEAYRKHSAELADEKVKKIREKIIAESPFSKEATEEFLNKIEEAADYAVAAFLEGKGKCTETN